VINEACIPKSIVPDTQIKDRLTAHWQGEKLDGLSQETLNRYKYIEEIVKACVSKKLNNWQSLTLKFDQWATHAIWGYLLFALIMLILFQGVFSLAAYPMEWIETSFQWASNTLTNLLPKSLVTSFLTDGLLSGLEGVIVFVPQIFILFFFIGILEDSGYMVRASFITDRIMRKLGLNGRSIIPMVGGFACAIPSIMATRSIKSKSERLATMLVVPLMSCSARLPVYVLLVSIAIPLTTFWGPFHAQTFVITAAYMSGIVVAVILAFFLNLFTKSKAAGSEFILELPTYQKPRFQTVVHQAWLKCMSFLSEAGKVIVLISMILWGLSNFGPEEAMKNNPNKLEASYAGHIGKFIEPAIEPLGYDWKTGIALISSFAAREVFVGTMGTLFQSEEDDTQGIRDKMQAEINPETGKPLYGIPYALSLIVFYAFALQCMSTMAVMKRETGSWKWPIIQFVAFGLIAYIGAFIVFQISTFLEGCGDSIPDNVASVSHHLFHFF
jgi:ferrous iron transport protein B